MLAKKETNNQAVSKLSGIQNIVRLLPAVIEGAFKPHKRMGVVAILSNGRDRNIQFGERFFTGVIALYRGVAELFNIGYAKLRNRDILGHERIEVGEIAVRYHLINQLPQHVAVTGPCICGACDSGCECGYECCAPVHPGPFVKGGC